MIKQMRRIIKKIKNKLYYWIVKTDYRVWSEYSLYVFDHKEEHKKTPWKHWWKLLKLNLYYRLINRKPNEGTKEQGHPYLFGPESKVGKRKDAYHFAQSLLKYDVISFDIFDTLVLRKVNKPTDVFTVVGQKLGIFDFYTLRRRAEKEIREIKLKTCGQNDVTLEDIYNRVAYYTGINPSDAANVEFSTELDFCYANPYMYRVYSILKGMGKKIVVTSDMYLPKKKMEELLKKCGYDYFSQIFISCDYGYRKYEGELYKELIKNYGNPSKIVHIGDSYISDVKMARENGIAAIHYRSCRDLGDKYRCNGMSSLISSAYRSIINTVLHNGLSSYSIPWEYGFIYGGLVALAYTKKICDEAKKRGIDKILFLSRDGFIFKQVYDLFNCSISSEYIYWSRAAALRCSVYGERYYFLNNFVERQINSGRSVNDMLELFGLSDCSELFEKNGINPEDKITEENKIQTIDILVNNWPQINNLLTKYKAETEKYIHQSVLGAKNIAIVDLGFSGKNAVILSKIIKEHIPEANTTIFLLGSTISMNNEAMILRKEIVCFLFSPQKNSLARQEIISVGVLGSTVLEKMFSALHPSFLGFNEEGKMIFSTPESDRKYLSEIYNGIITFCKEYISSFKGYPCFYNISSEDAYQPIHQLLTNLQYTNKIIKELTHNIRIS